MISAIYSALPTIWSQAKEAMPNRIVTIALASIGIGGACALATRLIQTKAKPVANLFAAIQAVFARRPDPLKIVEALLSLPQDEHGNITIGIDNNAFSAWETIGKHIFPNRLFGPIVIVTNRQVIAAILNQSKNGPESIFDGNISTQAIIKRYGTENSFAGQDPTAHRKHKGSFKEWLSDESRNIATVQPIIKAWLERHRGAFVTMDEMQELTAKILLAFLLHPTAQSIDALVAIKHNFTENKTSGYLEAKSAMEHTIQDLISLPGSYPHYLASQEFTPSAIKTHILTLMSVGFDNLQSALTTMLLMPNNERAHFLRGLGLMPPVWIQARKSKGQKTTITYRTGDESKTFQVHSSTLFIIPNHLLNVRDFEQPHHIHLFSQGPNSCPAQRLNLAAMSVLADELTHFNPINALKLSPPHAGVSLGYKQIRVRLQPAISR